MLLYNEIIYVDQFIYFLWKILLSLISQWSKVEVVEGRGNNWNDYDYFDLGGDGVWCLTADYVLVITKYIDGSVNIRHRMKVAAYMKHQ